MSKSGEEPGELEDRYTIERTLGRGGMGIVYLARQRSNNRRVALKVLRTDQAGDEETVRRFEREAALVARLAHPHIVALYGVEQLVSGLVLVMQYIDGGTLKERVRHRGALPVDEVVEIVREIADALAFAHDRGIIHRDVKPENIYLDSTGRALLGDFGIARGEESHTITMTGTAIGTPSYMSPEQIDGEVVDARSDIYSLGMVLWEMLTGVQPWSGQTLTKVIYNQKHEHLPALSSYRTDVPPWLNEAITNCVAKAPAERWPNAAALLQALGGIPSSPSRSPARSHHATQDGEATVKLPPSSSRQARS